MVLRSIIKILTDRSNPDDYEITSPFPSSEKERQERLEKALAKAIPQPPEKRLKYVVEVLESTSHMNLFFKKLDEMQQAIEELTETYGSDLDGCDNEVRGLALEYKEESTITDLIVDFIDRAVSSGKLDYLKNEIWSYTDKMTVASLEYANEILSEK